MGCETIVEGTGTRAREDVGQRLLHEVAQGNAALVIEATGHDGAIDQDADLVAQGVAEGLRFVVLGMLLVGPLEHLVVLQIEVIGQPPAIVTLRPGAGYVASYQVVQQLVVGVVAALIPEAKDDDRTPMGSLDGIGHHLVHILGRIGLAITLMRMDGDL